MKKASKRRMSRRTSDVLAPLLSLLEKDEVTRKKLSDLSIVEGNEMQSNAVSFVTAVDVRLKSYMYRVELVVLGSCQASCCTISYFHTVLWENLS